jgi:FkbM family methyltransferase
MMDGFWEAWITVELMRHIRPGSHVIDVGANCGYYSIMAAALAGPEGRVMAVEPQPRLAECIRRSRRVNGFSGLDVVECAVTAKAGEKATLSVLPNDLGGASLTDRGGERIDVLTTNVDDLVASEHMGGRLDLIKIDAEGAELDIWHGMGKTIESNPHLAIAMEFNPDRYRKPDAFLREITDAGFPLAQISPDGVIPETTDHLLATHGEVMLLLKR